MRGLDLFKGRHFNRQVIVLWVRWYLGFKPSTRDVVQTMAERGIVWTHTTILRWYSAMYRSLRSAGTSTLGR